MKTKSRGTILVLSVFLASGFCPVRAQQNDAGHASNFTSVEYFEPPHQQQVKSRLSGAEAQPEADGLLAIKQLQLETFGLDGQAEYIVNAPDCVYDSLAGTASSAGKLQVASGDGRIRVQGEGFLWRQNDQSLTISNRVRTVIETGTGKKIKL